MTARITTEFWISAYRKRLELSEVPVFVTKKGDDTAGKETEIDNNIVEQIKFDSDLWVLEVEDKNGRHLLDDKSLNV